jgi:hypothetical protein
MHHGVALGAERHVAGGAEVQLDAVSFAANDTPRPRLHSEIRQYSSISGAARKPSGDAVGLKGRGETTRDAGVGDEDRGVRVQLRG